MKLSKGCKNRIDLMTQAEKKALSKCAKTMAECEAISMQRAKAIIKWASRSSGGF